MRVHYTIHLIYLEVTITTEAEVSRNVAGPIKEFPTAPDGFTLNVEWHSFYKKRYCKKGKKYVPVVVTEDPMKKCGCEGKCKFS